MNGFTRHLMSQIHTEVRRHFPTINPMKDASVTGPSFKQFFVQIRAEGFSPLDDYYKAEDRYEARAKAWTRFLEKHLPIPVIA